MAVDLILFCDTGLEFDGMYHHIEKLKSISADQSPGSSPNIPLSTCFWSICPGGRTPNCSVEKVIAGRVPETVGVLQC